jgi:hypothetical protein
VGKEFVLSVGRLREGIRCNHKEVARLRELV